MTVFWTLKPMILYEDNDILVCHKMAGIPVQSAGIGTMDMESAIRNYLAETQTGKIPYVGIIHRLDQPVEGVLVFAKNSKAAGNLSRQFTEGTTEKVYLAITAERVAIPEDKLVDYLKKNGKTNTSEKVKKATQGAKEAVLEYSLLEEKDIGCLLRIQLKTGRHHQIRVQMAAHGMPLLGDTKYGKGERGKGLSLCSYRLGFSHPKTGKRMLFEVSPQGETFREFDFCKAL